MGTDGPVTVAVDAMGGDHAPLEIVKGAAIALSERPRLSILFVGNEVRIAESMAEVEAAGQAVDRERIKIRHATEVIEMGESPVDALRRKPDSSIKRSVEALGQKEVDALVSAGDTGGVVASATIFCQRLKGVKRHGIAIPAPTGTGGRTLLIDVGANIHCKPVHLLQYAIMASAYAQQVLGVEDPRIGLLSVGEEAQKGTDLVQKTRALLQKVELNFIGNVEGQSIFSGIADVIVCDGFVGNVILKVAEGLAESFVQTLLGHAEKAAEANPESRAFMGTLKKRLDYSATGGAPLLGVEGSIIICHGRSKAKAIANAIGVAIDFTRSGVNERIVENVAKARMLHRMADFFQRDKS